jgi:hypothetical protein
MTRKKSFTLFLLLFFLTAAFNFIARKEMSFSYAVILAYNNLYELNDQIRISHFTENENRSVSIAFKGNGIKDVNAFKVYCNNALLTRMNARELTFSPLANSRKYVIKVNDIPGDVIIDLDYSPDSLFRMAGNSAGESFEVTGSNIPIETGDSYSIQDWALTFDEYNSKAENNEAAGYIKDSMLINSTDSSTVRILKIAQFILQRVKDRSGVPTDSMLQLSPVNQLKCVQAGKSKLWCGNYAAIFAYFAFKAGIPIRLVSCGDYLASISSGTHMFNEVWIKENNCWMYVDLLAKTVMVKKGDRFLNVIDVARLVRYPMQDTDLVAWYFEGDSIVQKPFNQVANTARYYFHKNNSFTFYFNDYLKRQNPENLLERAKKIFYTRPYYAMYGDNIAIGKSQLTFRLITTYLMFILMGLCLFFGLRMIRLKKSPTK